jgi:hypothetical protein
MRVAKNHYRDKGPRSWTLSAPGGRVSRTSLLHCGLVSIDSTMNVVGIFVLVRLATHSNGNGTLPGVCHAHVKNTRSAVNTSPVLERLGRTTFTMIF